MLQPPKSPIQVGPSPRITRDSGIWDWRANSLKQNANLLKFAGKGSVLDPILSKEEMSSFLHESELKEEESPILHTSRNLIDDDEEEEKRIPTSKKGSRKIRLKSEFI